MDAVAELYRWGYIIAVMAAGAIIAHNLMKERKG